jgi:hypothetical protein
MDMIVPLLREMRAENAERHEQHLARFSAIELRLDKIEATLNSFRHALTADSLLSKLVTGEFESRSRRSNARFGNWRATGERSG